MAETSLWPLRLRLSDVQRRPADLELEADPARRRVIADALDLVDLESLSAKVRVKPWLDGAEVSAGWSAAIRQTCGVSLEAFDTALSGEFTVRVVPSDSPLAAAQGDEVSVDLHADDPPDVLEGEEIDVGAYLVEHLALEIDPFPRKPGVAFEPGPEERPASPFAVLSALKPRGDAQD